MLRRHFLCGLLAATSFTAFSAGAKEIEDPEPFVRALYEREIARHNAGTVTNEREFLALFTRETRQLWLAGRHNSAKVPLGPILNAFFGWGVLPGQPVKLIVVGNFRGPRVLIIVVDQIGRASCRERV